MNKITILSIAFFTLFNCCKAQETNVNIVTFVQGDTSYKISAESDSVRLERKSFSIKYFGKQYDDKNGKFYSAQVAVLDSASDTLVLKIGQNAKEISFFEPGTGMAPGENGMYDTIFIGNSGHHYLTYENENNKRVSLVSKNKSLLELEWKISAAFYKEKDYQFSDLNLTTLYFIIFIDDNLNGIIDINELKIIKASFK